MREESNASIEVYIMSTKYVIGIEKCKVNVEECLCEQIFQNW